MTEPMNRKWAERNQADLMCISQGQPPQSREALCAITAGAASLTDFLRDQYLRKYIAEGGSKIKFLKGRAGSGKTHLANLLCMDAAEENYLTATFSAKEVWLHDFREIYLEILRQCDLEQVLQGCANRIIREMGYQPEEIGEGKTFLDYLSEQGKADPISRSTIRDVLRAYFAHNPLLDNTFAACCSLLTGGILGHPVLEKASRDLLLAYLYGDKTVKLSQLRVLGLSPSRITKYNARNLLRSFAEVAHQGGYKGILVVIDDCEILMNRSAGSAMRYTRLRRDDAYESIRQLIDDIDNMHHLLFLLCCDRELMENDSYGVKSYSALWLRIQNEVVSSRFNRFADIIDLDRYADEMYSEEVILQMEEKLRRYLEENGVVLPVSEEPEEQKVQKLLERARFGGLGLPYMVNRMVLEGGEKNV